MTSALERVLAVSVAFLLLGIGSAQGEDGRDFAGFYDMTEVSDLEEQVSMKFTVEFPNYSGADVSEATVMLRGAVNADVCYATWSVVSVPYRKHVCFSTNTVLPRGELESWIQLPGPTLVIEFVGADGNLVQRQIEVSWMPLGEEE